MCFLGLALNRIIIQILFGGAGTLVINKGSVFYSAFILATANIILQLLRFIYRIFLVRSIGPEGMGVYQLIMPVFSVIIAVTLSGICASVSRLSSEYKAVNDRQGLVHLIRIAFKIFTLLFLAMALPTVLYSDFISATVLGDVRTKAALLIVLPCLLLTGIENIIKVYFYGIKKINYPIIAELLEQLVRISATVALLYAFKPVEPGFATALIITGMVISEIFSVACLTLFYKRQNSICISVSDRKAGSILKSLYNIAIPVTLAALIESVLSSANTVMIPRRLIASGLSVHQALGGFGIISGMAVPLFLLPLTLVGSLSTIIMPKLTEGLALKNTQDVKRKIKKSLQTTGLLAFLAIAVILPLSPMLCRIFYKQEIAFYYLIPIAVASFFMYYEIMTGSILNALDMQKHSAVNIVTGGIIQLIVTYFAAGNYGINGYLIGIISGTVITAFLNMHFVLDKIRSLH